MANLIEDVIDLDRFRLDDEKFRERCKSILDDNGVLVLQDFLRPAAIECIKKEGRENQHLAYYTADAHNIYLTPPDPEFAIDHPRNRKVSSSKGCITTDQIPRDSMLHTLYKAGEFRAFLCTVLGETTLHEYADTLSSINLHYASDGQELGWHYDNSSFAITLLIQKPLGGGDFDYVKDVRDADRGEMNYELSEKVLDGVVPATRLAMGPGALVLFRGRNSMHRVTPTEGDHTRMLVVLAYNSEPGIALSESARMTFYGRLE
jgi:hypothetical protein